MHMIHINLGKQPISIFMLGAPMRMKFKNVSFAAVVSDPITLAEYYE